MPTVVLGVTGCIGAYKACEVLRELQRRGADVHVVMTANAARFGWDVAARQTNSVYRSVLGIGTAASPRAAA